MHVRRTLIDGMHIPGSCSHPPSKCLGASAWERERGQNHLTPFRCYVCVQHVVGPQATTTVASFLFVGAPHPAHTMGTPTLVNFMRAVKSARDGSNRAEK